MADTVQVPSLDMNPGDISALSEMLNEPDWMAENRIKAAKAFNELQWPAPDQEEWRRTSIDESKYQDRLVPVRPGVPVLSDGSELAGTGAIFLPLPLSEHINGQVIGKEIDGISEALRSSVEDIDNRYSAWNLSAWTIGAFLYVPSGVDLRKPLIVEYSGTEADSVANAHTVVVLGDGSSAVVIQRFADAGGLFWNTGATVVAGDSSSLSFATNQNVGLDSTYVQHNRFSLGRGTNLVLNDVATGGNLVKARSEVFLNGPDADAYLGGLYIAGDKQHIDTKTVQYHRDRHAHSRAIYKGAVSPGGRSIYQGLIDVEKNAGGTDAYLTNNNLILGDGARVDSIPCLEIRTNDVKCSHGSTSGRIDAESLFYLMSRGIPPEEAKRMMIMGFFEEVLESLPEVEREIVRSNLQSRLV